MGERQGCVWGGADREVEVLNTPPYRLRYVSRASSSSSSRGPALNSTFILSAGRQAGRQGAAFRHALPPTFRQRNMTHPLPHTHPAGLKWAGGTSCASHLFTASYDGSVRALDVATGVWELLLSTEGAEFSCFDVTADGRLVGWWVGGWVRE